MHSEAKIISVSVLAAAIILSMAALEVQGANAILGMGIGYSLATSHFSPSLKTCTFERVGVGFANHFGLFLEGYVQNYGSSSYLPERFLYLGAALEFRFFQDIRRTFNPYVSLGVYGLVYLDLFGSGPPEYPRTVSLNFSVGTRIRLVKVLYFDPRLTFVPGSSSLALQAGLDLIL